MAATLLSQNSKEVASLIHYVVWNPQLLHASLYRIIMQTKSLRKKRLVSSSISTKMMQSALTFSLALSISSTSGTHMENCVFSIGVRPYFSTSSSGTVRPRPATNAPQTYHTRKTRHSATQTCNKYTTNISHTEKPGTVRPRPATNTPQTHHT